MTNEYDPGQATTPIAVHNIIKKLQQDQHNELLLALTEVLGNFGIQGYAVKHVEIAPPPRANPDYCVFYFQFNDEGLKFGITCTEDEDR